SSAIVAGDFANNGRTSLAIARTNPDSLQVELSNNDGTFSNPSLVDLDRLNTPLIADLNGDGAVDISVVDAAGDILFRAGRPGDPGSFAPPIILNHGKPSRGIALVPTASGPALASIDASDDFISFFSLAPGASASLPSLPTGSQPAQILAADLDGN